jgi:hypothetical protein
MRQVLTIEKIIPMAIAPKEKGVMPLNQGKEQKKSVGLVH